MSIPLQNHSTFTVRAAWRCGVLGAACLFLISGRLAAEETPLKSSVQPPVTRQGDHVDEYHGRKIPDPYRWLEEPRSDETLAWIEAQNVCSSSYLASIPQRDAIRQRLARLWDYERRGVPEKRGERYFFMHNDGLQEQSVLYSAPSPDGPRRELLDPNKLSADGTISLAGYEVSNDGRLLAYGLAHGGSDWVQWHVRDVATGEDLPDHLKWVKFSGVSWLPDDSGFYYSRYDEPAEASKLEDVNYHQKLYLHRLGEPQSQDRLIYARPDQKEWGFGGTVTEDGRYLVISVWRGTERKNLIFYQELGNPDAPIVELIREFEATYSFLGNDGSVFYFRSDADASNGKVLAIDVARPEGENRRDLIPERNEALTQVSLVGDRFLALYLQDARSNVRVHDLQGRHLGDIALPAIGTAGGFTGRRNDRESYYSFGNFVTPSRIYRYDLDAGTSAEIWRPTVEFDSDRYEIRQVFYESADGARVPMFITSKKGLPLDGRNPTLLYGYGGFNISLTPGFSVSNAVWLEMGGVYAVPNLRGGGEYGRAWHEAGQKANKQNVFNDFIAAAQWLIDNRYTSPDRLAISGRSNGGLLVGAAMTQRPELFAAALPGVGVMDMLRFHKFTIGWAWISEYGCSDDPAEFENLLKYSPLHNLRPGVAYPATLVTTADHDDRVVPAHSYKFAAALQAAQSGSRACLIRIETRSGHGAGTPTSKIIDQAADSLAFLARELDMPRDILPEAKPARP